MPDLRQGCATGRNAEDTAPADALVLFGAMGDLAHKKIFPALYHMVQHGHLDVPVIGVARGALVGPASGTPGAQPIVQVEDLDRLRLVVPVPEAYTAGIREGQQAAFSVPAYPRRTFHAPIARIARDVTQNTRTMAVELDVRNGDGQITPGSFATVEWPICAPTQRCWFHPLSSRPTFSGLL